MMQAVKRAATGRSSTKAPPALSGGRRVVKEEGGENDLLERIAGDPIFGVTLEQLKGIVDPHKYVGRAPRQTELFLRDTVQPVLSRYADTETETAEINL